MASDSFRLIGVEELKRALQEAPKEIRTKAVRASLRDAGKVIQMAARAAAPVRTGVVKRNTVVLASKFARRRGEEGVYIAVRPLRGVARQRKFGKAGRSNPNDPFYWKFHEFGTKKMRARPFMGPSASLRGEEAIRTFLAAVIPRIEKLNRRKP